MRLISRHNDNYTKVYGELVSVPTIKGELHLCSEGQRLYDEYCKALDDKTQPDSVMLEAWDAYYEHRMECDDCGYI